MTDEIFHDVALAFEDDPADTHFNTLVIPTRDVVVTIERDEEGDPLQPDLVILRSIGGAVKIGPLKFGDPDVESIPETKRLAYTFRDVPFGAYRVAVNVGNDEQGELWRDVILDLVVRKEGTFLGKNKLDDKLPDAKIADPPEIEPEEEVPADASDGIPDQVEMIEPPKVANG